MNSDVCVIQGAIFIRATEKCGDAFTYNRDMSNYFLAL